MQRATYSYSAGGVVVNRETGDIVVVSQPNNVWSLPKGTIESDEDPLVTAKREILEESGVTEVELVKELGKYKRFRIGQYASDDESVIKDIRMYLFLTDQEFLKPIDPKHKEARWVSRFEVPKLLTHEKDKAFFKGIMSELPPIPTTDE